MTNNKKRNKTEAPKFKLTEDRKFLASDEIKMRVGGVKHLEILTLTYVDCNTGTVEEK